MCVVGLRRAATEKAIPVFACLEESPSSRFHESPFAGDRGKCVVGLGCAAAFACLEESPSPRSHESPFAGDRGECVVGPGHVAAENAAVTFACSFTCFPNGSGDGEGSEKAAPAFTCSDESPFPHSHEPPFAGDWSKSDRGEWLGAEGTEKAAPAFSCSNESPSPVPTNPTSVATGVKATEARE